MSTWALSVRGTGRYARPCWSGLFSELSGVSYRQSSPGPSLPLLGEEEGWWEGTGHLCGCTSHLAHRLGSHILLEKYLRERGHVCLSGWGGLPGFGGLTGPSILSPGFPGSQSYIPGDRKGAAAPLTQSQFSTGPDSSASSFPHSRICSTSRRDGCRSWTSLER